MVCVEEDNDHINCLHSGTPCNCHGTSTMQLSWDKYYATEVTQNGLNQLLFFTVQLFHAPVFGYSTFITNCHVFVVHSLHTVLQSAHTLYY